MLNIVFEFYGDYWHGNPSIFKGSTVVGYRNADELYTKTKEREKQLLKAGYKVIYVWENEYNKYLAGKTKQFPYTVLNPLLK